MDDRHANKPNAEGVSVAQLQAENADGSSDSIELGLPHEPLSITFFKTAFSITGLGLPGAFLSLYACMYTHSVMGQQRRFFNR